MTTDDTNQDAGLIRRGIWLFVGMAVLAAVVLAILFRSPPSPNVASAPPADKKPSDTGWEIRYNAAAALARRGAAELPWDLLREMLDEGQQMSNFQVTLQGGKVVSDEVAARRTLLTALKSLADWGEKLRASKAEIPPAANAVREQIDVLAKSPIRELAEQAKRTASVWSR